MFNKFSFRKYFLLWDNLERSWRAGQATDDNMAHVIFLCRLIFLICFSDSLRVSHPLYHYCTGAVFTKFPWLRQDFVVSKLNICLEKLRSKKLDNNRGHISNIWEMWQDPMLSPGRSYFSTVTGKYSLLQDVPRQRKRHIFNASVRIQVK
jgi:hypothetical protein